MAGVALIENNPIFRKFLDRVNKHLQHLKSSVDEREIEAGLNGSAFFCFVVLKIPRHLLNNGGGYGGETSKHLPVEQVTT